MTACQEIIEHSPIALAITEGQAHTLWLVNAAFCALQGKQAEEMIGRPISEAISGLEVERVLALLDRVHGGEKNGSVKNLQYFDPGHSLRYKSYTVWGLPVRDGHPESLVIQITNFTEQAPETLELNSEMREINEQLILSALQLQDLADTAAGAERRLRTIIQGLNAIICEVDVLTGQFTFVSEQPEKFLGYPLERWTQEGFWKQVIHEEDYERAVAAFQRDGLPGDGDQRAFRVIAADGSEIWLRNITKAVRNAEGEVIKRRCIIVDVTEQQTAYLSLAKDLDRNQAIAEALQYSVLWQHSEKSFDSLKVDVFYEPALDEALLGGDFFDAFSLPNKSVMLVVGDVTGKGLKAAARTLEITFALRAFAQDYKNPADMITRLNEFICDFHHEDDPLAVAYVVLSLIVIDPITGAAQAASAGAEPPLVLRASGAVEEVAVRGLILGINHDAAYETTDMFLQEGDTLLMTTDGLTEARTGGDLFGSERLLEAARKADETGTLHDVGQAVLDAARRHGGGQFSDDVCLLLVRRDRLVSASL